MAPSPQDEMSAPGTAKYDSNTLVVGDGTWDFSKNTFLLPNLVGLNFETMRYNGMANRFATLAPYHTLVRAHAIIAAFVFLLIVPLSVLTVRFYRGSVGMAVKYHAMGQALSGLMLLAVFILGYFSVGPERSLTNPHHGIGVAIFVLFILQMVGGRFIKHIVKARSFRRMIHQWSGRSIALLGIIQVPLGLTVYGSPKFTFILYALWMVFLVLLYFILEFKRQGRVRPDRDAFLSGGRSDYDSRVTESEYQRHHDDDGSSKSGGGKSKFLKPLIAGAGIFALLNRRKKKKEEKRSGSRAGSRTRSRSRGASRSRSRSRRPEVLASQPGSASYMEDEKYTDVTDRRRGGGGFMGKLMGVGAAIGAAKLVGGMFGGKKDRGRDDEYSAVSTDTPSRLPPSRRRPEALSEYSEESSLPRRGNRRFEPYQSTMLAQSYSAADSRPGAIGDPVTPPRPTHGRTRSGYSIEESDRYESPSRRASGKSGFGKGILAGMGMGWLAKKMTSRKTRPEDEEESFRSEEDQRSGVNGSRYTGDGYLSPTRNSRRPPRRLSRVPPGGRPTASNLTSEVGSSVMESGPLGGGTGPTMAPYGSGIMPPAPLGPAATLPGSSRGSHSHSRHDMMETIAMPPMPPDPARSSARHDSRTSISQAAAGPSGGAGVAPPEPLQRADSTRRRRAGDEAMAAAAATAGALAAEEEQRRRTEERERERARDRDRSAAPVPARGAAVHLTVHDDRIRLRRLSDEEAARTRRRRSRGGSLSSSGADTPTRRRYRRESRERRATEAAAERAAEGDLDLEPPSPAFGRSGGSRRPKDSAYYSGQPGPSSGAAAGGAGSATASPPDHHHHGPAMSGLDSERSHGTWSGLGSPSPTSGMLPGGGSSADRPTGSVAADSRRQRRRLERQHARPGATGADMFD